MLERVVGLEELNRSWTIDEIDDANLAWDALQRAKAEASRPKK